MHQRHHHRGRYTESERRESEESPRTHWSKERFSEQNTISTGTNNNTSYTGPLETKKLLHDKRNHHLNRAAGYRTGKYFTHYTSDK